MLRGDVLAVEQHLIKRSIDISKSTERFWGDCCSSKNDNKAIKLLESMSRCNGKCRYSRSARSETSDAMKTPPPPSESSTTPAIARGNRGVEGERNSVARARR